MSLKHIATLLIAGVMLAACSGSSATQAPASGQASAGGQIIVGLITKTETNPFFVKMKEGAQAKADELGIKLLTGAGAKDGDNAGQVTALENMVNAGAKGILITPSDTKAIVPSIQKARDKGVVVIALDTATDPQSAVDALFATNNFNAGLLIGQWAAAFMAGKNETHTQTPNTPAIVSNNASMLATVASIQRSNPVLLPVIGVTPLNFGAAPGAPAAVRELDVSILHGAILERIFGIGAEQVRAGALDHRQVVVEELLELAAHLVGGTAGGDEVLATGELGCLTEQDGAPGGDVAVHDL